MAQKRCSDAEGRRVKEGADSTHCQWRTVPRNRQTVALLKGDYGTAGFPLDHVFCTIAVPTQAQGIVFGASRRTHASSSHV